jgi:tRNA(adenine34) deaminase
MHFFRQSKKHKSKIIVVDNLLIDHEYWMEQAFREAEKAYDKGEVPIGSVIVHENSIIGRGYNSTETLQEPTAHAEMIAITAAADYLGSRRLTDTRMYVTLEPCSMCAGAIVLARIPMLIFGASDPKAGACGTLYNIIQDKRLNHRVELVKGILDNKCSLILSEFFRNLRETN